MLRKVGFKGGIFPPKDTMRFVSLPIEEMPAPDRVFLPLVQHAGTPAKPIVKRGDRIALGQMVADQDGPTSLPVHSPVSGSVVALTSVPHPSGKMVPGIEIENDGQDEADGYSGKMQAWREAAPQEILQKLLACGICGMGGHGIPAHIKLSPPASKPIQVFCCNAAACEPYVTCDEQLFIEKTEQILTGMLIVKKVIGAKRSILAVRDKNTALTSILSNILSDSRFKDIELMVTRNKYPQGEEKILTKTITGIEISKNGSTLDAGVIVSNAATVFAIYNAVENGIPLYQRVITVDGPSTGTKKNLLVRIGTPIKNILEYCNADIAKTKKVLMGGPMTGIAQSDLNVPVIKTTTAVFAYDKLHDGIRRYTCINCGMCIRVCPMRLTPCYLMKFVNKGQLDQAASWGIQACTECGACSYVCPSKINLVHFLKLGKYKHSMNSALE